MSNEKPQALGGPDSEEQYLKGLLDSRPKSAPIPCPTISIDQARALDQTAVIMDAVDKLTRASAAMSGVIPPNIKPNHESMKRMVDMEREYHRAEQMRRMNSVNIVVMDSEMEPMGLIEISHDILRWLQSQHHLVIPLHMPNQVMPDPDAQIEVIVSRMVLQVIHVPKGNSNARGTILVVDGTHSMHLLGQVARSERHALEIIQNCVMQGFR